MLTSSSARCVDASCIAAVNTTRCQVKPKGARKITFEQFLEALRQIATRKELELAHVEELVLASPGPLTQATQPSYVKFHDDKVCCRHNPLCVCIHSSLHSTRSPGCTPSVAADEHSCYKRRETRYHSVTMASGSGRSSINVW